jgi:hypothetical protein
MKYLKILYVRLLIAIIAVSSLGFRILILQ